ncbi:hypothetical protein [Lacticaseibacillus paracasei]|jgi:hypothetical protein|uniref:hypothetical protein n=1 Tax=Lacticaseibacillus paracasei TaxID=1597 RepID=UPI003DA66D7C
MLVFTEGSLREILTGFDAFHVFMTDLESRSEINCVSVMDYLRVRQSISQQQQRNLDQVVSAKLLKGVASCQQHENTWYGRKAHQIVKNWLDTFANSKQVPYKIRLIATSKTR